MQSNFTCNPGKTHQKQKESLGAAWKLLQMTKSNLVHESPRAKVEIVWKIMLNILHSTLSVTANIPGLFFSFQLLAVNILCQLLQISFFYKKWSITGHFFSYFVFLIVNCKYVHYKTLPMTGFEPRTYGIRRDCSAIEQKPQVIL